MREERPKLKGRFNFCSFKSGLYNIIFVPFLGGSYTVIAENLNFADVQEFWKDLNDLTEDIYQISTGEEPITNSPLPE